MLAAMRLRIEAARALLYHCAYIVDLLKIYQRKAAGGDKESAKETRGLVRLAAALTPLTKYYSTEIANTVASESIQVLGGSGFMRDYPVERHFRDARITNIYEGTSQLQIVGAIGGISSGILAAHLDDLIRTGIEGPAADLFKRIQAARPALDAAVNELKARKEKDFGELFARKAVDLGLDLLLGLLLARQAARDPSRKRTLAAWFIEEMEPRVSALAASIRQGSRTLLDHYRQIVEGEEGKGAAKG
jgi:hypothetical protein